jgi:hypothetical protein
MCGSHSLSSTCSSALSVCEHLEGRRLMSVTATGLNAVGVANTAKAYVLASFTTTDSPLKARNYTATVNFEDGSSGKGTLRLAKGTFSVVGHHKYLNPDTYTASVTITDKLDGTSQTVNANVEVEPAHTKNGLTQAKGSRGVYFQSGFGGTWRQIGNNYRNKTITATRVADTKDIIWSGNIVSASVIGAYSLSSQQFGFFPGSSGGSYTNLFNVSGSNATVSGGIGSTSMPATYRLARTGDNNVTLSSNPADNPDKRDHMITYQLKGLAGQPADQVTYVIFWEDTPSATSDFDFNDLIVELTLDK